MPLFDLRKPAEHSRFFGGDLTASGNSSYIQYLQARLRGKSYAAPFCTAVGWSTKLRRPCFILFACNGPQQVQPEPLPGGESVRRARGQEHVRCTTGPVVRSFWQREVQGTVLMYTGGTEEGQKREEKTVRRGGERYGGAHGRFSCGTRWFLPLAWNTPKVRLV